VRFILHLKVDLMLSQKKTFHLVSKEILRHPSCKKKERR